MNTNDNASQPEVQAEPKRTRVSIGKEAAIALAQSGHWIPEDKRILVVAA